VSDRPSHYSHSFRISKSERASSRLCLRLTQPSALVQHRCICDGYSVGQDKRGAYRDAAPRHEEGVSDSHLTPQGAELGKASSNEIQNPAPRVRMGEGGRRRFPNGALAPGYRLMEGRWQGSTRSDSTRAPPRPHSPSWQNARVTLGQTRPNFPPPSPGLAPRSPGALLPSLSPALRRPKPSHLRLAA